jgi:hypothetical protein
LFRRERLKALLVVNITGHVLVPWRCWRSHGSQDLRTSNDGSSLIGDEEFAW